MKLKSKYLKILGVIGCLLYELRKFPFFYLVGAIPEFEFHATSNDKCFGHVFLG